MNRPERFSPAARDVAIAAAITIGFGLLATLLDLHESLFEFTRRFEHLQLDELSITLVVLALCLAWLSVRRHRQTRRELATRRAAETRLAAVLEENRELARRHVHIQEDERKHLARELHDELGQYLNVIKVDAVTLAAGAEDVAHTRRLAAEVTGAVDHVHGVVRDIIRRLRPAGLDELGLAAAIEQLVDQWQQRLHGARCTLSLSGRLDQLDESVNLTAYRLVQEAFTNAHKHAGPRHVDVSLHRDDRSLRVQVRDDGRGAPAADAGAGFGLRGMRERVELMGGTLRIDSPPGGGFVVEALLPLGERP